MKGMLLGRESSERQTGEKMLELPEHGDDLAHNLCLVALNRGVRIVVGE